MSERTPLVAALLLLALIFGASLSSRVGWIEGSLPYPRHLDERFITAPALRMLQSGSPDPGFFRYPSLPIYLASLGMGVGTALSIVSGDLDSRAAIESVGRPYYSHPMVMRVPRVLHALLASATLLLVAAIGYRLRAAAGMLVLGPAVLAVNGYYHDEGWRYLNVDMIASLFALAATLQLLRAADRPSFRSLVVGPALLCGATIASKYPSGLILAPAVLAILWYAPRELRVGWVAALVAGAGAAFVLFCPYSVLSFDAFVADVLHEVNHYASGRAHHEANRGFEQMVYYGGRLLRDSGPAVVALAGIGCIATWRADWRRAVLLGLFPVSLFLLLSIQRVHFHRNLIPAYGMFAVAAAIGVHVLHSWLVVRLGFLDRPRVASWLAASAIAVVMSVSSGNLAGFVPRVDSRNRAMDWVEANLPSGGTLVVPSFLKLSGAGLPEAIELIRPSILDAPLTLPARDCFVLAPDPRAHSNGVEARIRAEMRNQWLSRHAAGRPAAEFGRVPLGPSGTWGSQLRIRVHACRSGSGLPGEKPW